MIKLKRKATGDAVALLQELLNESGYDLLVTSTFGQATDGAVRDFQAQNGLISDGVVYTKTWTKLLSRTPVDLNTIEARFLQEKDVLALAKTLSLESAVIKAVNEIESSGRGFLVDGRPKILFEGHIFWRELAKRGIDPAPLAVGHETVLYQASSRKHYLGGKREYDRLDEAIGLKNSADVAEAAYASASWGAFQIMGYHYAAMGYTDMVQFVGDMKESEGSHLRVFGKFLIANNLVSFLKSKDWAAFAERYNGKGFRENKYDEKMAKAYEKYRVV